VEKIKYLGTTLTNQNSIQEEIKRKWNSGDVYCHTVKNLSSSTSPSKNVSNTA